jgi:peptide-methionine (R)-S-oxide reductase
MLWPRLISLLSVIFIGTACHAEPVVEGSGQHAHAHHDHALAAGSAVKLSDAEWKKKLTPTQYRILREKGTERAGTGSLLGEKRRGTFRCAGCGAPLFESNTKFESGTGWPSFSASLPGRVAETADTALGMSRVEILCSRCGGHLGHVFPDGPAPTGQRFCVNSASLEFEVAANTPAVK